MHEIINLDENIPHQDFFYIIQYYLTYPFYEIQVNAGFDTLITCLFFVFLKCHVDPRDLVEPPR